MVGKIYQLQNSGYLGGGGGEWGQGRVHKGSSRICNVVVLKHLVFEKCVTMNIS